MKTRPGNSVARSSYAEASAFHDVLVCLDRSEQAEAVLPLASHVAQMDHARITLLHVLETPPDSAGVRVIDALEWEILREEARSYLEDIADRTGGLGVEVITRVAEGSPAHCAAELAESLHADLLVISTSGRATLDVWPLGRTARTLLALTRGPVLIVPAAMREPAPHVPLRRVLVALDGSVRGECVLPTVLRLARADDAEVVLAHVVPDPIRTEVLYTPEDLSLAQELADRLTRRASEYLERIKSQLEAAAVRVTTAVTRAPEHRESLVALAASERADLVVLSAHGSVCNPRRRFGSVATYVIAHSRVPVLVIQDLQTTEGRPVVGRPSRLPPRSIDAATSGG